MREARRRGQIAVSRDLVAAAGLAAGAAVLAHFGGPAADSAATALRDTLTAATRDPGAGAADVTSFLAAWAWAGLALGGPVTAAALLASGIATLAQTGGLTSWSALNPDAERLDPIAGVKRLVSVRALAELVKAAVKIGVAGAAALSSVVEHGPTILRATPSGAEAALGAGITLFQSALGRAAAALLVLGACDVLLQRWLWMRDLRMTKDEVRRDMKEDEGDPHIRSARRRAHREIAAAPIRLALRSATVVVVNPTHFAAALAYAPDVDDSPRLVAKGAGAHARRIRREAERAGIPEVQNPPLARALFALDVDDHIPETLYAVVAEVFAAISR
jgi:type III secretion protein U